MGAQPLKISCPVLDCKDKQIKTWYHGDDCGGDIWVNSDAYLICWRCEEKHIIFHWNFKCKGH
jgi:hypothetical protein